MIHRTKPRMAFCLTLLSLNLLFIWGNSALSAELSAALSNWVRDLLGMVIPPVEEPQGGYFLRKLAHFSEFASLGLLFAWLMAMLSRRRLRIGACSLLSGFLSASLDETIQIFSPGRCPSPVDVGIDTAGVAFGIGLLLLGQYIYQKNHKPMEALT